MSPRAALLLRRFVLLGIGAVAIPALLLVVVFNLENPDVGESANPPLFNDFVELIPPEGLTERDLAGGGNPDDVIYDTSATGGWIQTVDPDTGRLAQRYRFDRLDPNPDDLGEGWFRLTKPEAEIYLDDGRVVTFTGDDAIVRAPAQALESGTITGDVEVRLYERNGDAAIDFAADRPAVEATTGEAKFDTILGEIRCDGEVLVEATDVTVPGRGVTIRFNDRDEQLRVRVDHVHHIHVAPAATADSAETPDTAPTPSPASPAAPETPDPVEPPSYYLLTLHDNVIVRRGDAATRQVVRGERLNVVFSTETEGLDTALSTAAAPMPSLAAATPHSPRELLLRLVQAAPRDGSVPPVPEPGAGETVITCNGGLTLVPLEDETLRPARARDALILIEDDVTVDDVTADARATCTMLRYDTGVGVVEMHGIPETPLSLTAPDVSLEGDQFRFDHTAGIGAFRGPGRLELAGGGRAIAAAAGRDPGAGDEATAPIELGWRRALDFQLSGPLDADSTPTIESAQFAGGVTVRSAEATLDSDAMDVVFAPGPDGEPAIQRVTATGAVKARDLEQNGMLRGDELVVDLRTGPDGDATPDHLAVRGNVSAEDERQKLWAQALDVSFVPDAGDTTAPQVDELVAEGDVQVRLAGGARAYGDRLVADARDEHAELIGDDSEVVIVHEGVLIDGGDRIIIDQQKQSGRWPGPGRFRSFADPLIVDDDGPLPRPDVAALPEPQVDAGWTSSMVYDDRGDGGVELFGDVTATVRRTPLERNTLEGEQLTIRLASTEEAATDTPVVPDGETQVPFAGGDRTVARMIARGDARLESRTWQRDDNTDVPTVFYIDGEQIDYDVRGIEADVLGEGTIVVRDERPETDAGARDDTAAAPFSGRGTSMFKFADRLRLRRGDGDEHVITMSGGVQATHKALDGRTASMTGDTLAVHVGPIAGAAEPAEVAPDDPLGLGGAVELRRVIGTGSIYIRTPTQRIECDLIDYDIRGGIAILDAQPQRVVTIFSPGSTNAMNAKSVRWDVKRDVITVIEPTGIGGR